MELDHSKFRTEKQDIFLPKKVNREQGKERIWDACLIQENKKASNRGW